MVRQRMIGVPFTERSWRKRATWWIWCTIDPLILHEARILHAKFKLVAPVCELVVLSCWKKLVMRLGSEERPWRKQEPGPADPQPGPADRCALQPTARRERRKSAARKTVMP